LGTSMACPYDKDVKGLCAHNSRASGGLRLFHRIASKP
jgi:hypothetical protein